MRFAFQINEIIINVTKKLNPFSKFKVGRKLNAFFHFLRKKKFSMSQTFLSTINGLRKLKRLRWMVWLIIYGYFSHGVTSSTLDVLSRTMVILLLLLWLMLGCCSLSRGLKEKPISFYLVLNIFICLSKTAKK